MRDRPSRYVQLAGWAKRNRKRALGLWVAILVATVTASAVAGEAFDNSASLPGTESQQAIDTLRAQAPAQAGDTIQLVLRDRDGIASDQVRERIEPLLARVAELPSVAGRHAWWMPRWTRANAPRAARA